MLDLLALPSWYLTKYGSERVAEVAGCSPAVVGFWIQRNDFPLAVLQKLLDFDPEPLSGVKSLYENPTEGTKLAILCCSNRAPSQLTVASLIKMYDPRTMVYQPFTYNSLFHVRNMGAAWFLRSNRELSFWSDDDSVHPCGDPQWFKDATGNLDLPSSYAGVHTINRLISTGKKIVGSSYVSRSANSIPQFGGGKSMEVMEEMRIGPRNAVIKRDWVGFGGILIHRDVFLDIIKTQGDEIRVRNDHVRSQLKYEHSFFRPNRDQEGNDGDESDDISFCARARKAGHEIFVDMAISAGHIGTKVYTHRDIRKK